MKTLAIFLFSLATALAARAEYFKSVEKFTHSYPVSEKAELSLQNSNGSVEIIAWDKNEVAIEAEKRTRTAEDQPFLRIEVEASPDHISIVTKSDRTGFFKRTVRGDVRYKLFVPAGINLRKITVTNAGIKILNVSGVVNASTVNGSIHATALASSAILKSVNGSIDASFASVTASSEINAHTVNGSCKLTMPDSISAELHASTVNGRVHSGFPVSVTGKIDGHRVDGKIGPGPGATIEIHSVNGNVHLQRQS